MKKDLTELVFILDRSGSMGGLESDTIGGFNSLIEKQKTEKGEAIITTVLFDNEYELLHDRINLKGIRPMTSTDYFVRGSTALLDAIGKTVNKTLNAYKNTAKSERAEKTLFVITTDGLENASREYSHKNVKELIEKAKKKYNFEFIFLGANIDAIGEAKKFGIDSSRAVNYVPDTIGTQVQYAVMCDAISEFRGKRKLSDTWKKGADEDYKKRK